MDRRLPEAPAVDHLFHDLQHRSPEHFGEQRLEIDAEERRRRRVVAAAWAIGVLVWVVALTLLFVR